MANAAAAQTGQPEPTNLVKKLHHGLEEGSAKRKVGEFLESTKVEIFILLLVVCDIVLLGIEHGIDRHHLCIEGNVAPLGPGPLVDLAHAHADEHGSFLQEHGLLLPGPPSMSFLSAADVAPGSARRTTRLATLGDTDTLTSFSNLLSPLALLQDVSKGGVRTKPMYAVNFSTHDVPRMEQDADVAEREHEEHGNNPEHGHDEHGQEEHGHEEHGHDEHGHEEHGHGAHGHHHIANEALVCETRHGPNAHEIEHRCHMLSILILVIFLVEILMKIWVNAPEFFGNPWEVLDLVVVSLSLLVDVVILPMLHDPQQKHDAETAVGLLMICRLWRVVRIFHGLFEVVHHQVEEVHMLNERIKELERELAEIDGEKPEP